MHAYYAARAPEYDAVYAKPERQADLRAIEPWVAQAFAGRSVLEVACGTGYWTQFIAPSASGMLCLDAAAETLRIAAQRVPPGAVRYVVGDAWRLPVARAAFDGAFAGFWLSHVPLDRLPDFFDALHRTLRPGATVVMLDNRFVEGSSTPIAARDADGNTYQLRRLRDGSTHRVLKNFPTGAQLFAAAGASASALQLHEWPYYWALRYTFAPPA